MADRYAEGSAAAVYASAAAAPNELQVAVSGEKVNLRNFWSGQFGSTWVVSLGPEGAAAVNVAGEIKVRAHYFEEGNVQLQTKKTLHAVPLHVAGGGVSAAAAVAQAVADHIAAEERLLQVRGWVCVCEDWALLGVCGPVCVVFFKRGCAYYCAI